MTTLFKQQSRRLYPSPDTLDNFLNGLSIYLIPVVLAVMSLITLCFWNANYVTADTKPLAFRAISESSAASGATLSPTAAIQLLADRPLVRHFDTRLSERPVWFSLTTLPSIDAVPSMLEFPSRHAMETACWDAKTLAPLGTGSREFVQGGFAEVKAGFSLSLQTNIAPQQLLCRATFVGPARLSVFQWPASQLQIASQEFHRNSGLLDGGLIVLALFVLIAAVINRNKTYVLFATWLVVNLRMGALSAGWDTQWLGHALPPSWMSEIRSITISLYYMLTLTLFCALFRDDLVKAGYPRLLRIAKYSCPPLILLSVVLPYKMFLPLIWTATGFGSVMLGFFLIRILSLTRSPVAMWYTASIGITLFAGLYEVISAALGLKGLIGTVNSVTAALSSSLLAALAIAQQMRIEHQQRKEAQAELEHTYHAMPIGLFSLDAHGQFLSANPAMLAMLDSNVLAAGRNTWAQYFNAGAWERLHEMVHAESDGEMEVHGKRSASDGVVQTFMVKATLARGRIEGSLQDVTKQVKATEDLRFMANNDPLTKVLNRRGIEHVLDEAMLRLAEGKPLALAYLDLDRFKLINDLYGHAIGDEVLKQVCDRVGKMLTSGQRISRVGGDEFVIVMPDTAIPLATWICRGIVNTIGSTPFRIGDKAFQVRGSIGLIEVSPGTQIRDAMATADRACRAAKNGHHEGLVVYEKNAAAFREREAELDLVERLSGDTLPDTLFVDMQPIMSLRAPHESLNFEVLLRMRDEDGSVIPAGRIISAAEASGRISAIDRWVMATTLAWLEKNHATMPRTQFVCMNLSGASLNDERFVQDAFLLLSNNLRSASRLCIEITESVALHDLENTRRFIDKVRGYGAKVALDDFGAGYTSFSYLRELPADILKIDGSFIVDMNQHPANIAIVEAIVSLAANLGMKTIAEWAEDNATVQTLAEIGVDYVQGFAVSRPQSPARILAARSAASFIDDEALASFVLQLGCGSPTLNQTDLLDVIRFEGMH